MTPSSGISEVGSSGHEETARAGLKETLDPSKLRFVQRTCDLCGSEAAQPVCSVTFLGVSFQFVLCRQCHLVYQNPLLDKESRHYLYQTTAYWDHKHASSADSTMLNYYSYLEDEPYRRRNAELALSWMRPSLPPRARTLDLGCADGVLVDVMAAAGCRASGLDVSPYMIERGRERYRADIRLGDFEEPWPFDGQFDVVTCFAALSNFVHPSAVFENIQKHLKPGGSFFFNFGDHRRLVSRALGARLYLYRPSVAVIYSRDTVAAYCRKHGLQLEEVSTDVQVVPLARLLGFLRVPGLLSAVKLVGLEASTLRLKLLTGYRARAVRRAVG